MKPSLFFVVLLIKIKEGFCFVLFAFETGSHFVFLTELELAV